MNFYYAPQIATPISENSAKSRGTEKSIKRIYGVEPSAESHPGLRQRVKEAELEGVYEILPVGIEAISKASSNETPIIEKGAWTALSRFSAYVASPSRRGTLGNYMDT